MEKKLISAEDIAPQGYVPEAFSIDDPVWQLTYPWWEQEWTDWERILPRGGFIEDFVLATKGLETATSFAVWTGLITVASTLSRDAYLSLYPASWYPNLYAILVAPPGLVKKSTIQGQGLRLLRKYHEHIRDPNLQWKKELNLHTNRVTPEGLQDLLIPIGPVPSKRLDTPHLRMDRGSQLVLFISELATFLGRQTYNLGMISKLTDLYDSKEHDSDYTKKDGKQDLRNIYVNFLAATTPKDLNDVIPQEAFGGGLMTRTTIIYEPETVRYHPLPMRIEKGPSNVDLEKALAWIAVNSFGSYTLSKEALGYYYSWYERFKKELKDSDSIRILSASRMDVLLLKVAILIRAQRYEPGREITIDDITKARQILDKTYRQNETAVENVGATARGQYYNKLRDYIQTKGVVTRKQLLTSHSRYLSSDEVTSIVSDLLEVGFVEVWYQSQQKNEVSKKGDEEYVWIQKENL